MATEKREVIIQVSVQLDEAKKQINKLKDELKSLTAEIKLTPISDPSSSKMMEEHKKLQEELKKLHEQFIKLQKQLRDEQKKTTKQTEEATKANQEFNQSQQDTVKGNQDGTKTIAQLKSELKALAKQIENTGSGTVKQAQLLDEYQKKQKELNQASRDFDTILGKQKKSLGGINENFDFTTASLGEMEAELKRANKAIRDLVPGSQEYETMSARIRGLEGAVRDYKRELKGSQSIQDNIIDALNKTSGSADDTRKAIDKMTSELDKLRSLKDKVKPGTAEFKQLDKEINKAEESIAELNTKLSKQTSIFNQLGGTLKKSFGQIPALMAASFSVDAIKQFGGEIIQASKEFNTLKRQISLVTGASGQELDSLTARLKATADTFGESFERTFKGANSLAQQMGISFEEAIDLVNRGFLQGANTQGEFLDILKEYPAQFKAAGFSAEQLINITTQTQKEGIFSDKGVDAIKEFGLRIREQTKPVSDALTAAFGSEFTENLFQGLNEGTLSTQDALQKVSRAMNEVTLDTKTQQTLIADVFSSAGEDAGEDYIKNLDGIIEKSKELSNENNELVKSQERLLKANEELNQSYADLATELGGTGTTIDEVKIKTQAFVIDAVAELISWIKTLSTFISDNKTELLALGAALVALNFTQVVAGVRALATATKAQQAITKAATVAQLTYNAVLSLNPISFIIISITALIVILKQLSKEFIAVSDVWAKIQAFFIASWGVIKKTFFDAIDLIWSYIDLNFITPIMTLKEILIGVFTLDPERIKQALTAAFDKFKQFGTKLINFFTNLWTNITEGFVLEFNQAVAELNVEQIKELVDEQLKNFNKQLQDAKGNTKELNTLLSDQEELLNEIKKRLGEESEEYQKILKSIQETQKALENIDNTLIASSEIKDFDKTFKAAEESTQRLNERVEELKFIQNDLNKNSKEFNQLQSRINKAQDILNKRKAAEQEKQDKNNKALEKQKKLLEAINKLRLEAEIELVGGEDTIDAINIFRERAIKALKAEEGFALLRPDEQQALLDKVNRIYDTKLKELQDNTISKQEATLKAQLELQQWALERQQKLLDEQQNNINASFEDSLQDQSLIYDKQLFLLQNRLEKEQEAIEKLNKDLEDGLIDPTTFEKRSKMLIDQERETLKQIADIEIEKIKTQQAGVELQIQTELDLMQKEKQIFMERLKNEREFLEAKIALQPRGLATQEQEQQLQVLRDQERKFNDDQLNMQTKLNNELERKRFESSKAIQNIQKSLNNGLKDLQTKQNDNTKKASDKQVKIEDEKWQKIEKAFEQAKEFVNTVTQAITDIQLANLDKELQASDERVQKNDETITKLEESREGATQRQQERIDKQIETTKKQNEEELKQQEKLEKERKEIEKKQFLISQAFAIADVIINTARSIAATLATPAGALTGGLPWSAINAAIGAAQIATITAQTVSTQFAKGGVLDGQQRKGGVFRGRSHAEGGIMINNGAAEVEGDEIILTKGVYRNPIKRAIASALNVSEGGVPFATGGLINKKISVIPKLQAGGVNFDNIINDSTMVTKEFAIQIGKEFQKLPPPVVSVDEINTVQSRVNVIESNSSF